MNLDCNGLEALDRDECRHLLAGQALGRLGVIVDGVPVVTRVNYRLVDGALIMQTDQDTRLGAAANHTVVMVAVDCSEGEGRGWSVVLTGSATEITDPNVVATFRAPPPGRDVSPTTDRYIKVSLDTISGRRATDGMTRRAGV